MEILESQGLNTICLVERDPNIYKIRKYGPCFLPFFHSNPQATKQGQLHFKALLHRNLYRQHSIRKLYVMIYVARTLLPWTNMSDTCSTRMLDTCSTRMSDTCVMCIFKNLVHVSTCHVHVGVAVSDQHRSLSKPWSKSLMWNVYMGESKR